MQKKSGKMKKNKIDNEILQMRIFTVDNDKYNVFLIKELLLEAGFINVETFLSGEELISRLEENQIPDIILSDILMPTMSGYELCKTIKSNPKWENIPIIMITAASMKNSEPLKLSFEYGAMDFISKPVNHIELRARVKSALKLEKQRKELKQALAHVKTLQGLLPICSYCKKIRSDNNYWEEIDHYISAHSDTMFSHSVCPDCYKKYVEPEIEELKKQKIKNKK